MANSNNADDASFVFGSILLTANKMDTLLDKALHKHNLTSKQWFLLLIMNYSFESPPTIKELANEMSSSLQNVKQIALKLEEKGMLELKKDKKDLRVTRLVLTEKSYGIWETIEDDANKFIEEFYTGIENNTLENVRLFFLKIMQNIAAMEETNSYI